MKLFKDILMVAFLVFLALSLSSSFPENKIQAQFAKGQPFSAAVSFVGADATKVIVAAPGAAGTIWVTYLACTLTLTTATTVDFDNGSTTDLIRLSASAPVNIMYTVGPMIRGISLGANTPLQYTPNAAGPAGNCVAEGYIVRTGL